MKTTIQKLKKTIEAILEKISIATMNYTLEVADILTSGFIILTSTLLLCVLVPVIYVFVFAFISTVEVIQFIKSTLRTIAGRK